ncbi:MFS transporter [Pseudoneobacillus rhizosphaerae]|uniref:Enterobactin exporter EntS n=1 Tax=Pseudoneobacillus rhizosphaerae TaxID=2880968 RepID=A0A9C7L932_9BACI|nr:MFS transporter [Pseudoneobacillus rhizosphaerae]CAG9606507.1 Enterobactin exporter EntS [Pseudoneobacillus rhizosphaerae]
MREYSFRTFFTIWFGQLASIIGSGLTNFGLGVWVLTETGSVTQFALIIMFASVPAIVAAPFAGVIVDKWKRKWLMVISDSIAGISTIIIFVLIYFNVFEVWHLYITAAVSSLFSSFQMPAYQATIPLLVPKAQLGRANGLVQMADALSIVFAPVMAGFLLASMGIKGILIIDFFTFIIALSTLLFVKFPELSLSEKDSKKVSFFQDALFGWRYIVDRPGLRGLLVYFAVVNLLLGYFNVLLQPLILSFTNERMLGIALSITGIGMLVGGITMSIWGGPKNRVLAVIGSGAISGLFLMVLGFKESVFLVTLSTCLMFLFLPIGNAASQVIWQSKVPLNVQGRVFALRRMIAISLSPIAYISAGPLVEKVFDPAVQNGGFAQGLTKLIGTGDGRGIGLLFILLGAGWIVTSLVVFLNPRVRGLESEIPDAAATGSEGKDEKVLAGAH